MHMFCNPIHHKKIQASSSERLVRRERRDGEVAIKQEEGGQNMGVSSNR